MKKLKFLLTILIAFTFISISSNVHADSNTYSGNDIERIYQKGRSKGIINDSNLNYNQFEMLMNNSVIPAYENQKSADKNFNKSLDDFTEEDHYEVTFNNDDSKNLNLKAINESNPKFGYSKIRASKTYSMKKGDILVCYGPYSGTIIGHAALALSSNRIIEMPGPPTPGAVTTSKKDFFSDHAQNAKNGKYVAVYRLKNYKYASDAADYAYNKMYLGDTNPSYWLNPFLSDKMHSYCSKYVFLAFYNTHKSTINGAFIESYGGFIHPHSLQDAFASKTELSTVTSY